MFIEKRKEILFTYRDRQSRQMRMKSVHPCFTSRISAHRHHSNLLRDLFAPFSRQVKGISPLASACSARVDRSRWSNASDVVSLFRLDLRQLEEIIDQRGKDLFKDVSTSISPIELNGDNQWTIVRAKSLPANDKVWRTSSSEAQRRAEATTTTISIRSTSRQRNGQCRDLFLSI